MRFSLKNKIILIFLLIILNLILRFQAKPNELGIDSFIIHIMVNSLSEYGYAKWVLHPLSFAGLYPYSYSSSVQFLVSGIHQLTALDMNNVLFLYNITLGIFSFFTGYLIALSLIDDDFYKIVVALGFSTVPSIVAYTTYSFGTRPFVIVFIPLLMYLLFKYKTSYKNILLCSILGLLLFVSHKIISFLFPFIFIFFIFHIFKTNFIKLDASKRFTEKIYLFIPVLVFFFFFSIPFIFKKFLEEGSRYQLLIFDYFRYSGPLLAFAFGGIFYLIFKQKKSINEWIFLLSTISLTTFIYEPTYMKWFIPIFIVPMAGFGLMNIIRIQKKPKLIYFAIFVLFISIIFTSYFQFINEYRETPYNKRFIEDETHTTGLWMKNSIEGDAISNDRIFSFRIFSASENIHFLTPFSSLDQIYGYLNSDISLYKRYPLSSEEFWFSGFEGPDEGEQLWESIHKLQKFPNELNIKYVVENMKGNGRVIWHHTNILSKLLEFAYGKTCIYDSGNIRIWFLD